MQLAISNERRTIILQHTAPFPKIKLFTKGKETFQEKHSKVKVTSSRGLANHALKALVSNLLFTATADLVQVIC